MMNIICNLKILYLCLTPLLNCILSPLLSFLVKQPQPSSLTHQPRARQRGLGEATSSEPFFLLWSDAWDSCFGALLTLQKMWFSGQACNFHYLCPANSMCQSLPRNRYPSYPSGPCDSMMLPGIPLYQKPFFILLRRLNCPVSASNSLKYQGVVLLIIYCTT